MTVSFLTAVLMLVGGVFLGLLIAVLHERKSNVNIDENRQSIYEFYASTIKERIKEHTIPTGSYLLIFVDTDIGCTTLPDLPPKIVESWPEAIKEANKANVDDEQQTLIIDSKKNLLVVFCGTRSYFPELQTMKEISTKDSTHFT